MNVITGVWRTLAPVEQYALLEKAANRNKLKRAQKSSQSTAIE